MRMPINVAATNHGMPSPPAALSESPRREPFRAEGTPTQGTYVDLTPEEEYVYERRGWATPQRRPDPLPVARKHVVYPTRQERPSGGGGDHMGQALDIARRYAEHSHQVQALEASVRGVSRENERLSREVEEQGARAAEERRRFERRLRRLEAERVELREAAALRRASPLRGHPSVSLYDDIARPGRHRD
eukprot:TRINITY_DN8359_c0_g1_i2.p1 TRINITY_DN8359_c0_g1~~TRINITY_DN8359_c0_g1_i2.p1  ORF type:complete len:190 (+),score=43.59 TRINITY_DN8359_c0_g1_i2:112-681(+)